MKEENITINKGTIKNWAIILLSVLLVISLFTGGFGIKSTGNVVTIEDQPTTPAPSVNM